MIDRKTYLDVVYDGNPLRLEMGKFYFYKDFKFEIAKINDGAGKFSFFIHKKTYLGSKDIHVRTYCTRRQLRNFEIFLEEQTNGYQRGYVKTRESTSKWLDEFLKKDNRNITEEDFLAGNYVSPEIIYSDEYLTSLIFKLTRNPTGRPRRNK